MRSLPLLLSSLAALTFAPTSDAQRATLDPSGRWQTDVRHAIESWVAEGAGRGEKAVFDFDNTLVCRDIGEATFAAVIESGRLVPAKLPAEVSPSFRLGEKTIALDQVADAAEYYEAFLQATEHQEGETEPYANGYGWIVQAMSGMTAAEVVEATRTAYADAAGAKDALDPALGQTRLHGYRQPFFYPEMVDFVALLLENGFDVWVVSASNVWSVRWMVTQVLSPMLAARAGKPLAIPPDHVLGISVLVSDRRTDLLAKDALLVGANPAYAKLDPTELGNFVLTTSIVPPMTAYSGKVAAILDRIVPERPFLIAGDSPNDHPMLDWARHRLWIARLEKPSYQRATIDRIAASRPGEWLVQPVLVERSPGFVPSAEALGARLPGDAAGKTPESVRLLSEAGLLGGF